MFPSTANFPNFLHELMFYWDIKQEILGAPVRVVRLLVFAPASDLSNQAVPGSFQSFKSLTRPTAHITRTPRSWYSLKIFREFRFSSVREEQQPSEKGMGVL